MIKNNNTCKDFLIEALKYHLLPADQRHLIKTDRTRPRTPISIPKVPKRAQTHRRTPPPRVHLVTGDCATCAGDDRGGRSGAEGDPRRGVLRLPGGPVVPSGGPALEAMPSRWSGGGGSAPLIRPDPEEVPFRSTVFPLVSRRGVGGGPRVRGRGLQQFSAGADGRRV